MTDLPPLLPRISDYAAWQARIRPDEPAMMLEGAATTYGELAQAVDRQARALLAAGVLKGDRVATLQTPHPQYLIDFLATASIGAIWVGLNPRYQLDELRHVMVDAEPRLLLARAQIGERRYDREVAALQAACPGLRRTVIFEPQIRLPDTQAWADFLAAGDTVGDADLAAARAACGGRDPCLIVYTSGSTGAPKGRSSTMRGLAAFSLGQDRLWPISPYRSINYFPINHVGCVADCTLPCLVAGGLMIFMEKFDPGRCLALMAEHQVTLWGSVPTTFGMMLDHPDFPRSDLGAVQLIVWGGAAMPGELIARLAELCPRLGTNYGMTETTSAITALEPLDDLEVLAQSVGGPFEGVEMRLAGEDGAAVGPGAVGEVQARSRLNFLGYWRRPDATAEAFTPDGFFRTGDLAVQRPDGRYRIVGRKKEMYKSGGYNVYPREVEAVLETHPAVTAAAVVSIPDPVWQEVGVAYVSVDRPLETGELDAHCRARLANYKLPKRIVIETDLPLLPIGKIDKAVLRVRAAQET